MQADRIDTEHILVGKMLADHLRQDYGLEMEMTAGDYVVAILTVMDTEEGFERLQNAVLELDRKIESERRQQTDEWIELKAEGCYTIARALELAAEQIALEEAEGRICGEFIYVYPPGIPILAPGEKIKKEHLKALHGILEKKLDLKGMNDGKLTVLCQ